jgi:hypothetical protein
VFLSHFQKSQRKIYSSKNQIHSQNLQWQLPGTEIATQPFFDSYGLTLTALLFGVPSNYKSSKESTMKASDVWSRRNLIIHFLWPPIQVSGNGYQELLLLPVEVQMHIFWGQIQWEVDAPKASISALPNKTPISSCTPDDIDPFLCKNLASFTCPCPPNPSTTSVIAFASVPISGSFSFQSL